MNKILIFFLLMTSIFAEAKIKMSEWELAEDYDGIKLYRKEQTNSDIFPLMVKAPLNHKIEVIMSVLAASSRRKEWIPRNIGGRLLKKNSEFDRIEYTVTNVPWPFDNREFVYRAITKIDKDKKVITISMKSFPWKEIDSDNVRGFMHDGSMIIRQIKPKYYEFTMMFESDPKGSIPKWIVNYAQKKWPVAFVRNLRKQIKKVLKEGNYQFKGKDLFKK
jgi:predicted HNH restriction endonuclease